MTDRIPCVGECMLELSGAAHDRVTLSYGGDTLNTADYLAKPNFVCVVGNWVAGAKDTANQDRKCIEQKA